MSALQLELYVIGGTLRSQTALSNLRQICAAHVTGAFELQVIDVLEQPQAAEDANIVATPTLIRRAPAPVWRLHGDLSRTDVVLRGLGITSVDDTKDRVQHDEP